MSIFFNGSAWRTVYSMICSHNRCSTSDSVLKQHEEPAPGAGCLFVALVGMHVQRDVYRKRDLHTEDSVWKPGKGGKSESALLSMERIPQCRLHPLPAKHIPSLHRTPRHQPLPTQQQHGHLAQSQL